MRAPLAISQFRQLFLARCASLLGDSIFIVAIAFAVFETSGDAARPLSLVFAAGAATLVLSFLVSGVWGDRLPRVGLMLASDLARLCTQAVLATLLLSGHASLATITISYVLYSIATAFFEPARAAIMPQLLAPHLLVSANGLMGTAQHTVSIIGWALGGVLVAVLGPGGAIAVDAATFAVSAWFIWRIGHVPSPPTDGPRESFARELAVGWRELTSARWLWFTVLWASIYLLLYEAPMQVLGPLTMEREYAGALTWGFLGAALATGSVLGALLVATQRLRRPMLTSLWLFLASVPIPVLLGIGAPFAVIALVAVVAGTAWGMFEAVWNSSMQHLIPPDKLSRVAAWDWMGSIAGMPLGFVLAGVATHAFGLVPVLWAMSGTCLLVTVVMLLEPALTTLGDDMAHIAAPENE